MTLRPPSPFRSASRRPATRGSVLITALILAAILGAGLVGYLRLSSTALKLSQRTLFGYDAANLADAGLEDALYSFNRTNAGVAPATAWSGWTLSGSTARRTLTQFNRDQNGVGTVKVFVNDYNNGGGNPYVVSQATITPFDGGAPIVRIVRIGLKQSGLFTNGLVGLNGVSLKGQPFIDSFNSNPTNSPTGPWLPYSAALSAANVTVVVKSGSIDLGKGEIKGNVSLGAGVAPPPDDQVTGTIQPNYTGSFTMPAYPTAAGVSRSYSLGSAIPAVLPVAGHLPAADGRYYYFVNKADIAKTTIAAGANVTLVGTATSLGSKVKISSNATLAVYIDGDVDASGKDDIDNANWAGALQIFTTSDDEVKVSGNGELRASIYAPNATLRVNGNGSVVGAFIAKSIVATGKASFHYDEALRYVSTAGGSSSWKMSSWGEIRPGSDLSALGAATGGFLP